MPDTIKKLLVLFILLFFFPETGKAFVPETPHLLYLVCDKLGAPEGIEIYQTKKILNYLDEGAPFKEQKEKLSISYPQKLRLQHLTDEPADFSVESEFRYIRVTDDQTAGNEKPLLDFYTDLLLYRTYDLLLIQLEKAGIDTGSVSLQRLNEQIFWVIGDVSSRSITSPALWIEKDSFLPSRYIARKNGSRVEIVYGNWQKIGKSFYPFVIHIFHNNRLAEMIDVNRTERAAGFPVDMFDIDLILESYKTKGPEGQEDHGKPFIEKIKNYFENLKQ